MMSTIKIGPLTYQVKEVEDLRGDAGQSLFGSVSYGAQVIKIDSGACADRKQAILWHEVLHAILDHAGQGDAVTEEAIVALGFGIAQVLAENPAVTEQQP